MKKGKYIFIIILFVYAILITSGTYAYLYAEDSNTNTFAGNMSTANVDLEVNRVTPSEKNGTSRLVPLLDAALKNALKGNGGVSSCVDANKNVSCEVYKITLKNTGKSTLKLTGTITLVASGTNNMYQNLKWELLDNATTRKSEYKTNGMARATLEKNFSITPNETKEY